MSADDLRLARIAREQHGVFSRAQALASGFAPRAIARRVASGRWRRLGEGVYASRAARLGPRAQWWAGLLRFGEHAVLSHDTAGRIWQLPVRGTVVHVTVAPTARFRSRDGVTVHRLRLDPAEIRTVDGFPVTSFLRTVLDCCAELDDAAASELLEHVLEGRHGTVEDLSDAIRARVGWPGAPRLLHLVAALDGAASDSDGGQPGGGQPGGGQPEGGQQDGGRDGAPSRDERPGGIGPATIAWGACPPAAPASARRPSVSDPP